MDIWKVIKMREQILAICNLLGIIGLGMAIVSIIMNYPYGSGFGLGTIGTCLIVRGYVRYGNYD